MTLKVWALFAGVALLMPLLVKRGIARAETSKARAAGWWLGAVFGATFIGLTLYSLRNPPATGPLASYDLRLEIIRAVALVSGVVYVVYTALAVTPLALEALQRRGFTAFVGARMLSATKSGFLTVISVLSVLGVSVSSCALCSVTSIMGGFGHDLKRKILGNTAHIVVDVADSKGFASYEVPLGAVRDAVRSFGGAATPVVGGDAMASSATNTAGVLMRGIDPGSIGDVINLKQNIEYGRFDYLVEPQRILDIPTGEVIGRGPGGEPYHKAPPFSLPGIETRELAGERKVYPGIILGRELAKSLHVMIGDRITLLSPMGDLGPAGIMPKSRRFLVAGVFYSGMYEYDASTAYVMLPVAQEFFEMSGRINKIDVRIPDPEGIGAVRPALDRAMADVERARNTANPGAHGLRVRDWKEMNKNLFSALKLEKLATFIILSIAITVASFCIICTLLLMVTEKAREIAVLKALGAPDGSIMRIFMIEGVLIGAIGTALGVAVALAACLGLEWSGVRLDPDVYYIDRLPVNVDLGDYLSVSIAALAICTLATIYPAYTAARVRPVDGLRYE
ncbi:MAG: FtsX-like permease family protein [Deltaproteobacteria bacterium]|nr:FtsX-like permease family protein [Deltaproteobacteria bacterium]